DWNADNSPISCLLAAPDAAQDPEGCGKDLFLLMNPSHETVCFKVPRAVQRKSMKLLIDTGADSPDDFFGLDEGPELLTFSMELPERSTRVYIRD
ncbi:MAG: hypothetical protein ACR2NP_02515, partial [Pirellulaceae bacterium]